MNQNINQGGLLLLMLPILGVILLVVSLLYWLTLGKGRRQWGVAIGAAAMVAALSCWRAVTVERIFTRGHESGPDPFHTGSPGVTPLFWAVTLFFIGVGGLVMALRSSWGLTGWQNWLRWRTVVWSAVMAAGMAPEINEKTFTIFLCGMAPFLVGALVSMPTRAVGVAPAAGAERNDRERVLGLLERGAITGDEAAELLAAMGEKRTETAGAATGWWLLQAGAALVALGFLLPWAKIDLGQEMHDLQSSMMQQLGANVQMNGPNQMNVQMPQMMMQGAPGMPGFGSTMSFNGQSGGPVVEVHAADLAHGMGWVILGVAVAAAVLPLFREFRRQAGDTRRTVLTVLVGIGTVLSIYLGYQLMRYVQAGLVANLMGYALMVVAMARQFRPAAPALAAQPKFTTQP
jgi:hypothetical protein